METATRQNIEIVQRTTNVEIVNRHACKFLGKPTAACIMFEKKMKTLKGN